MCLGELAEVMETGPGPSALVRSEKRTTTVSLLTLDEPVAAGDWVVCHSGFALSRVSAGQAVEAALIRATAAAGPATTATTTTESEQ